MRKKYQVIFSRYAEDDLKEIIDYYLGSNAPYAAKLLDSFESRAKELNEFPERGRLVPELEKQNILDYRETIEGNYRIIFAVDNERVIVHTVLDARRNVEEILLTKLLRYYN